MPKIKNNFTVLPIAALLVFFLTFLNTSPGYSDTAQYIYDDLGRLSKIIVGNIVTNYAYDEVGNVLSGENGSLTATPSVTAVSPTTLLVGVKTSVTFTGTNLLTASGVTSLGNNILVDTVSIKANQITAWLTATSISGDTIKITFRDNAQTVYQTAMSAVTSTVVMTPAYIAAPPNSVTSTSVSLNPPIAVPVTIGLKSSDMSIAAVPNTLTIPAGGSANLLINTKLIGFASITNRANDIYGTIVTEAPIGGNGIYARPVSVTILPSVQASPSVITAKLVSVTITPAVQQSTPSVVVAAPVSVSITPTATPISPSIKVSPLVSVTITQ